MTVLDGWWCLGRARGVSPGSGKEHVRNKGGGYIRVKSAAPLSIRYCPGRCYNRWEHATRGRGTKCGGNRKVGRAASSAGQHQAAASTYTSGANHPTCHGTP